MEASDAAILGRRFQLVVKGGSDARSGDIRAAVKMIDATRPFEIAISERPIGIVRRHQQDPTVGSPFKHAFRARHDRRPRIQLLKRIMKGPDLMDGGVENPCERKSVPWPKRADVHAHRLGRACHRRNVRFPAVAFRRESASERERRLEEGRCAP